MSIKITRWGIGGERVVERDQIPEVLVTAGWYGEGTVERLQSGVDRLREVLKHTLAQLSDAQLKEIAANLGFPVIDE